MTYTTDRSDVCGAPAQLWPNHPFKISHLLNSVLWSVGAARVSLRASAASKPEYRRALACIQSLPLTPRSLAGRRPDGRAERVGRAGGATAILDSLPWGRLFGPDVTRFSHLWPFTLLAEAFIFPAYRFGCGPACRHPAEGSHSVFPETRRVIEIWTSPLMRCLSTQ